jgi:predicted HTH transcriptional regulator
MMTLSDIESWVRRGESATLELKRTTSERREAARTLCAMLNHQGARVIFGVEPDGRIIGQMVSDRTVEDVARKRAEIELRMFPSIEPVDDPLWSPVALREAPANAFCYRDYRIGGSIPVGVYADRDGEHVQEHPNFEWAGQAARGLTTRSNCSPKRLRASSRS